MVELFNLCRSSNKPFVLRDLKKVDMKETVEEMVNYLAVSICLVLRNEKPAICYGCVLEYIYDLKNSNSKTKQQRSRTMFPSQKSSFGGFLGSGVVPKFDSSSNIDNNMKKVPFVDFMGIAGRAWKGMKDADAVRKEFLKK
jgi:hypothetical protein